MEFLEKIKLDTWWKFILLLGIGFIACSLYFQVDFIENKHLFGFGIGLIFIGISFWIAETEYSTIKPPNAYTGGPAVVSWKEINHNPITIFLFILGIISICIFGFLILKGLI